MIALLLPFLFRLAAGAPYNELVRRWYEFPSENDYKNPITVDYNGALFYALRWPTCANDPTVSSPFGATTNVTVQPDCDNAIESACQAVKRGIPVSQTPAYYQNITSTVGTCEVHIQFPWQKLSNIYYDDCIKSCQAITETCMLLGVGQYAAPGQQAGLSNMYYGKAGVWKTKQTGLVVNTVYALLPGYMIGPPGYFTGLISQGVDPSKVTRPLAAANPSATPTGPASNVGPSIIAAGPVAGDTSSNGGGDTTTSENGNSGDDSDEGGSSGGGTRNTGTE